jgi:hypothetical protein
MASFWLAFWPNLLANIAGIAFGVPLALWIDRKAAEAGARSRRAAAITELGAALLSLEHAISDNRPKLDRLAALVGQRRILTATDTGLDYTAWSAVQPLLAREVGSPDLRRRLAFHFSRVQAIVKMVDLISHSLVSIPGPTPPVSEARLDAMGAIADAVTALQSESPKLVEELATYRTRLRGGTALVTA